jgi:ParB family chromosome partitioning protein
MRRALGKGLTQLLGEQGEAGPNTVEVSSIRPNSHQPRRHFDEEALQELAASIAEVGVLLPLIVRPVADGEYELIAGERRWRAAQIAGLDEVPVIVRSASAQDSLEIALIENVQREDISPVECAIAYRRLSGEFGLTQDEIAQKVGKSRSAVANTMRVLALPAPMQQAISEGFLTEGHARALLMVDNPRVQEALFEQIVNEGLSVREAERLAKGVGPDTSATSGSAPALGESRERAAHDPNDAALERQLSELFGTPVKIARGKDGGKISVPFYSDEDLQRILDLLGVEL